MAISLPRRTLLRGAGACLALPLLEIMSTERAAAQSAPVRRFVAFFYPNGTDPRKWNPAAGALTAMNLPECLRDLGGFAAEGIWPAGDATFQDVTAVTGIDHSGVCVDIHMPSMALSAHKGTKNNYTPAQPTLDQYLAERLQAPTPYRNLALAATPSTDIGQGNISFRESGQVETVTRNPKQLFDSLFRGMTTSTAADPNAEKRSKRNASVLDAVKEDHARLNARLGRADQMRIAQYLQSVSELEKQVATPAMTTSCSAPAAPTTGGDWHSKSKQFIDLLVLAMACDLTRVVTLQYSDSWGVNYSGYTIGSGKEALGTWSDHFISHKLDDTDRATDLDGLDRAEAQRIADARVVATSRFKVRRFAYLVNALKNVKTPSGTLLDESLVMYCSENGDGDSHARKNMPILLAGHAGGFKTGRSVAAANQNTGALHASIIQRFGFEAASYGSPAGKPIAEL
ncbi:MAG TPA: DUF1552 domain-containing protein [Polyangiaceae bacterium]|nr:DUF1552 domain-containing protein [Polyangiaceae bacterium]